MTRPLTPARRRLAFASAKVDEPTLFQFVVLSMLVHVLLVVLFGDTSRGGARRGEDLLGTLDVTLKRLTPEPGTGFRLSPGAEATSPGAALFPQRGGQVSTPVPRPRAEPSLAPEPTSIEPHEAPSQPREISPPVENVPRLSPDAREEVDKPLRPDLVAPAIEPSPRRIEPIVPPRIEREWAPPAEAPARAVPAAPAAVPERVAPPQIQRELTAPAELAPRETPMVPSGPLERLAPRPVERELAEPTELPPREVPLPSGAPIERSAPPTIEREFAPPAELPSRTVPAAPGAPIERVTAPTVDRQVAPPVAVPAPRPAPVPSVEPERGSAPAVPSAPTPPAEIAPSTPGIPAQLAPQVAPTRPAESPLLRQGTPGASEDIFKPRGDRAVPSAEPGAAPRIDLDAAKKRAVRAMANEGSGSRGVLPFPLPVPPEKKSKEANPLEKAIKPDCRTAYAGLGLLAAPALIAAAISDEAGCRW